MKYKRLSTSFVLSLLLFVSITSPIFEKTKSGTKLEKIYSEIDFKDTIIEPNVQSNIHDYFDNFQPSFSPIYDSNFDVKYQISSSNVQMIFEKSRVVMKIRSYSENIVQEDPQSIDYTTVILNFEGSNLISPEGIEESDSYLNILRGNNEESWQTKIPQYNGIIYKNLYDNIDLIYRFRDGNLKYDFYVHPGGNYKHITMAYQGSITIFQDASGMNIKMTSQNNEFRFTDSNPINYLGIESNRIPGEFILHSDNSYGFKMDPYDESQLLVIDPILGFSTLLGGDLNDNIFAIDMDSDGYLYVTGYTESTNFPTTSGAYNETSTLGRDVFVSKFSPDGRNLIYSTYIGGDQNDQGNSITVDDAGYVYVTGYTSNYNVIPFPTTLLAFDRVNDGPSDAFVFKLDPSGSSLEFSTLLGGADIDAGNVILLDSNQDIYIAGQTYEFTTNFPTTPNALNETHNGQYDGFISLLDSSGSVLVYSTLIGGDGDDNILSMTLDGSGNVYITGNTPWVTNNYPTTPGALNTTHNTGFDAFISKLTSDLSTLISSTFLGSASEEVGTAIAVNANGEIYVAGNTNGNFPTTSGVYDESANGADDVFVAKLNTGLSSLLFSTFLGGSSNDQSVSIALDSNENIYISGTTYDGVTDFPVTDVSLDSDLTGASDGFATILNSDGSELLYSTFLGGSQSESLNAMLVENGNFIIVGGTNSYDGQSFPTTAGAFDESLNYLNGDAFVTKIIVNASDIETVFNLEVFSTILNNEPTSHLLWNRPYTASEIVEYRIFRGSSGGQFEFLGTSSDEEYFDRTTEVGIEYSYFVSFAIKSVEQAKSNNVSITLSNPTPPQSPINLNQISGTGFVTLSWNAPPNDGGSPIIEYRIYRGTTSGSYDVIFVTDSLYFNDTYVEGGTNYFYVLTAINNIGESQVSSELSVSSPPVDPVVTTVTTTLDGVTETTTIFGSGTETITTTETKSDEAPIQFVIVLIALPSLIYFSRRYRVKK